MMREPRRRPRPAEWTKIPRVGQAVQVHPDSAVRVRGRSFRPAFPQKLRSWDVTRRIGTVSPVSMWPLLDFVVITGQYGAIKQWIPGIGHPVV